MIAELPSSFFGERVNEAVNKLQLFVGLCILLQGILFYYFLRNAEHIYFIQFFGLTPPIKETPQFVLRFGYSLPTFIHVFAFSLISAGIMTSSKKGYTTACLFWFVINVLFEFGQKFDSWVVQYIPNWFSEIPFLENTKSYFLQGSFDYLDLFSITLGALVAYIFLITTTQKGRENEKQIINCG